MTYKGYNVGRRPLYQFFSKFDICCYQTEVLRPIEVHTAVWENPKCELTQYKIQKPNGCTTGRESACPRDGFLIATKQVHLVYPSPQTLNVFDWFAFCCIDMSFFISPIVYFDFRRAAKYQDSNDPPGKLFGTADLHKTEYIQLICLARIHSLTMLVCPRSSNGWAESDIALPAVFRSRLKRIPNPSLEHLRNSRPENKSRLTTPLSLLPEDYFSRIVNNTNQILSTAGYTNKTTYLRNTRTVLLSARRTTYPGNVRDWFVCTRNIHHTTRSFLVRRRFPIFRRNLTLRQMTGRLIYSATFGIVSSRPNLSMRTALSAWHQRKNSITLIYRLRQLGQYFSERTLSNVLYSILFHSRWPCPRATKMSPKEGQNSQNRAKLLIHQFSWFSYKAFSDVMRGGNALWYLSASR